MQDFDTSRQARAEIEAALTARDEQALAGIEDVVREIIDDVRRRGDAAVVDYVRRFDWPEATAEGIEAPIDALKAALANLGPDDTSAPRMAAANIEAFHKAEMGHLQSWMQFRGAGQMLGQVLQPVKRVGVYVPGGKAFYPSTLLMSAIPARVAGVEEIVVCTPAGRDGSLHPLLALAADYVDRVFKIGGAPAIAAMAYGTETVPAVDVIVGPGNHYVDTAKRMVYGTVGIDMPAGPSEVAIIADEHANPALVAADLIAQTEHGPENRGVLFSPSAEMLAACRQEMLIQRAGLSRLEILRKSEEHLIFVKTKTIEEAVDLSNVYAPEHLELCVREPLAVLGGIRNAGAVLLGEYTSAPAGDYIAGPSHTLPTAGTARFASPLSCGTFIKRSSVLFHDATAAAAYAPYIARFAEAESFDGHAAAARKRA